MRDCSILWRTEANLGTLVSAQYVDGMNAATCADPSVVYVEIVRRNVGVASE